MPARGRLESSDAPVFRTPLQESAGRLQDPGDIRPHALVSSDFVGFDREVPPRPHMVTLTEYGSGLAAEVAFPPLTVTSLAEVFDFARDYLGLLKAAVIAAGIVPHDKAFSGFSDDIVVIVASALLVSGAVARSGLIERVVRRFGGYLTRTGTQVLALTFAVTLLSAFGSFHSQTAPEGAVRRTKGGSPGSSRPRFANVQPKVRTPMAAMFLMRSLLTLSSLRQSYISHPCAQVSICRAVVNILGFMPGPAQVKRV